MALLKTGKISNIALNDLVPLQLIVPRYVKEDLEAKAKECGMTVHQVATEFLDEEKLRYHIRKEVAQHKEQCNALRDNSLAELSQMLRKLESNLNIPGVTNLFKRPKKKVQN